MRKQAVAMLVATMTSAISMAAPLYRAEIAVSASSLVAGVELADFPVLVRISESRIQGFSYALCAPGGADISFSSDESGNNRLPFEIDTWNPDGESLVWVKIPSLANGTKFYLAFSDTSPAANTPASTWKADYSGVWHMREAAGTCTNSTAYGATYNAVPMGNTANSVVFAGGAVGAGRTTATAAAKGYLSVANYNAIAYGDTFTVSGWVRLTGCTAYPRLFSRKNSHTDANGWEIEMNSGSTVNFAARGASATSASGALPQTKDNWVHVALVYNGTSLTVYGNGAKVSSTTSISPATDNGLPMSIGCNANGSETYAQGAFDECRLMDGSASADWVAAEYNQVANAAFLVYGEASMIGGDTTLRVTGSPDNIGSPNPGYGIVTGLSNGVAMTLSVAVTEITEPESTVVKNLAGWELYSIDAETMAKTLVRSSAANPAAGETFAQCNYVHDGFGEINWLWRIRDTLGVGTPVATAAGYNTATLSVNVNGIGFTADSATLMLVYGPSPNHMTLTNVVDTAVLNKGDYTGTLTRLFPNRNYYVKALLETNEGETDESDVYCFATPAVDEMGGQAGLWQTFFTSADKNWTKDIWAVPEGTDWKSYTDANRIRRRELMPIAAYVGGTPPNGAKRASDVWGDQVYWPVNGGQWVYAGYVCLDKSKTYKFRTMIDDNERLVIADPVTGGTTVLINDIVNGGTVNTSGGFTPSCTGWHPIEIRLSDGSGGAGGYDTSNGYLNSNNLGWSEDGGVTWKLFADPGDGSLFRTQKAGSVTATENFSGGALTSVTLAFPEAATARDLHVVWGPVHGGNHPGGWAYSNIIATVSASTTAYTYAAPADWGATSNLVMRFYFAGDPEEWSNAIFWRDGAEPIVGAPMLDGTGGDTLSVSGTLAAFTGTQCKLTVYVGDSNDALDIAWTNLAGATLSSPGAFSLTLFESETSAPSYLAPGATYHVVVEAAGGGKVARSEVGTVTMSAAPAFKSSSSSVARRTVTFTGTMADLGAGASDSVTLWVGTANDEASLAQAGSAVTVTGLDAFNISHVFDSFETTYFWQFRAASTTAGGTESFETRSAIASCKTLDTTSYTWKDSVPSGNWNDAANWDNNQSGDCLGYPQSAAATVAFNAGTTAEVAFMGALTIGTLNLSAANLDVTFVQGGASTNATKLTASSSVNLYGVGGSVTFDNVAVYSAGNLAIAGGRTVTLRNGANVNTGGNFSSDGGKLMLAGDSWFSCVQSYIGGAAGYTDYGVVISNSTYLARSHVYLSYNAANAYLRFEGDHPRFLISNAGAYFYCSRAGSAPRLDFLVPVGGYGAAPITCTVSPSYYMGNNGNNNGASAIQVNVLDESPANRVDATPTTALISWPKGINTAMIIEGNLPDGDDAFVWDSVNTPPRTLDATIAGSTHAGSLTITAAPEMIAAGSVSPAYGETTGLAVDATLACSAPASIQQLSDTKRATCTGWKLYSVDPTTHTRTLVDSGATTSLTYTHTGVWHELEWQWEIEYKVTVGSAGNGTAAAADEWVALGGLASLSVTPADGYAFGKWTGDVPAGMDKTEPLSFTVTNAPYSLTAHFLKVYHVSQTGNNNNGGTSWEDALATIPAALAKDANAYVLLSDGVHPVTSMITLAGGATVAGATPGCKAIVIATNTITDGSIFKLTHADARLLNLAITTGYKGSGDYARGVYLDGRGLVDSCVITNCRSLYCGGAGGGGVFLNNGGIVRKSVLDYNSTYASGGNNAQGHNVYMSGGLVESCMITRGGVRTGASSSGGGVWMTAGVVRGCLVANNTQGHDNPDGATGVRISGGTLENCTIANNFHGVSVQTKGLFIAGACTIRNCIVWGNFNNGGTANWAAYSYAAYAARNNCTTPALPGTANITSDPYFADANNGDFRTGLSGVVDTAAALDWMTDAKDLDSRARILGAAPDMGCYEFAAAALVCGFDIATAGYLGNDEVTLTARVIGPDVTGLGYTWTATDSAGTTTTRSGPDLATVTLSLGAGIYDLTLDVTNGVGSSATFTRQRAFVIYGTDVFVAVNGAHTYPYTSPATAATNLVEALEAASDGTTVHVGDGWHRVAQTVSVGKGVRIISENGPEVTTIFGRSIASGAPLILINNHDAALAGLTISGKDLNGTQPLQWSGIRMTALGGLVTNCVIRDHKTVSISVSGAGMRLEGGTVVDCVFSNNYTLCSGGAGMTGGGIDIRGSGALVDRCVIANNTVANGGISYGGGVYINAGTIRNSLIVGNYSVNYGGGLAVAGTGAALNCTVVRNTSGTGAGGIHQNGGTVTDCVEWRNASVNEGEDPSPDPGFEDGANGDYHPVAGSSLIDAGTRTPAAAELDLARNARVSGSGIDLGCYELDASVFVVGVSCDYDGAFGPRDVTFTATVMPSGLTLDGDKFYWTFDGTAPSAVNHAATGISVTRSLAPAIYSVRLAAEIEGSMHTVDKMDWLTVYPETVFVMVPHSDTHVPSAPYGSWETAATNLAAAMPYAIDGATVILDDGVHPLTTAVAHTRAVTVTSRNGRDTTTVQSMATSHWQNQYRCFTLTHDQAVLSGLTIRGGYTSFGGALRIDKGVVTNCFVAEGIASGNTGGGGAYMTGGTLVDSVLYRCRSIDAAGNGAGLWISGPGLADRCTIISNYCTRTNPRGGGVNVEKGGVVRNSLIAFNENDGYGAAIVGGNGALESSTIVGNFARDDNSAGLIGGVYAADATARIVNCIIAGNYNQKGLGGTAQNAGGTASCFSYCAIPEGFGTACVAGEPLFKNLVGGDFHLRSQSPCVNAALRLDWMNGGLDRDGQPRIYKPDLRRSAPDIGCYESTFGTSGMTIIVR